jgi:hypothetical protein
MRCEPHLKLSYGSGERVLRLAASFMQTTRFIIYDSRSTSHHSALQTILQTYTFLVRLLYTFQLQQTFSSRSLSLAVFSTAHISSNRVIPRCIRVGWKGGSLIRRMGIIMAWNIFDLGQDDFSDFSDFFLYLLLFSSANSPDLCGSCRCSVRPLLGWTLNLASVRVVMLHTQTPLESLSVGDLFHIIFTLRYIWYRAHGYMLHGRVALLLCACGLLLGFRVGYMWASFWLVEAQKDSRRTFSLLSDTTILI